MALKVAKKPVDEKQSSRLVQQTAFWARVKEKQGCRARAFDFKLYDNTHQKSGRYSSAKDDILIILRPISANSQMAYVPYGPNLLPESVDRGIFLEELSESLRPYLPETCLLIRYDLSWESPWSKDVDGQRGAQMPDPRVQEMRMNFGTHFHNLFKAPTDILPAHTVFLDLEKANDQLLKKMKPKTRYNIRLALRKGVKVHDVGHHNLETWYRLYAETAARNGINNQGIGYFRSVLGTQASGSRSPAKVSLLLAEYEGKALAGMVLAMSGGRATYLYGASSSKNRNLMPSYALQWEGIRKAKAAGCQEYDMFGIAPAPDPSHPMYGLYRFKTGFGGNIFHRQGCWDYPFDEKRYENYRMAEMNSQGFHSG